MESESDEGGIDLGNRPETSRADRGEIPRPRMEREPDRQTSVRAVSGRSGDPRRDLALHEDCCPVEEVHPLDHPEENRRRDRIGKVTGKERPDAWLVREDRGVEVEDISRVDAEAAGSDLRIETGLQQGDEAGIDLDGKNRVPRLEQGAGQRTSACADLANRGARD